MATFYIMSKEDDDLDSVFQSQSSNLSNVEPENKKYKKDSKHKEKPTADKAILIKREDQEIHDN